VAQEDRYSDIAERYDYMLFNNPEREGFFKELFLRNKVGKILDCACGTGRDLLLFNSFGYDVSGSDMSDSMLAVARRRIHENGLKIPLYKADFQGLQNAFAQKFDAVVCLGNAISEADVDVVKALNSMKSVLNSNGIIVLDQGQTDLSMRNPPKYSLEVNDRDFSRLFTMDYTKEIMTVNVFDILHKENQNDFKHSRFEIRIRLYDDWREILKETNLVADYYGYWDRESYNKTSSRRMIIVARKNG